MSGSTKKLCRKPSRNASTEERAAYRQQRRAGKAALRTVVGFFPMANARIDAAIQAQVLLLTVEQEARKAAGTLVTEMTPADIQQNARNAVARLLPAPRQARRWQARPSKSDDAAYRRGNR